MEKTVLGWINELPEGYRKLSMKHVDKYRLEENVSNLSSALLRIKWIMKYEQFWRELYFYCWFFEKHNLGIPIFPPAIPNTSRKIKNKNVKKNEENLEHLESD